MSQNFNFCELHNSPHNENDKNCISNKNENYKKMRKKFEDIDLNRDNHIDEKELKILVTEIFKNRKKISELKFKEEIAIDNTVRKILKNTDLDKNGKITFDEFIEKCQCKNFEDIIGNII